MNRFTFIFLKKEEEALFESDTWNKSTLKQKINKSETRMTASILEQDSKHIYKQVKRTVMYYDNTRHKLHYCQFWGYTPFLKLQRPKQQQQKWWWMKILYLSSWGGGVSKFNTWSNWKNVVIPVFFQTLQAFSTLQPDKFFFLSFFSLFDCCFVSLKKGLTLKICTGFILPD